MTTKIRTTEELGQFIRTHRKNQKLPLEQVSAISHLGIRFLSELERGKETAEIGKVLKAIHMLGLEILIQPRTLKTGIKEKS